MRSWASAAVIALVSLAASCGLHTPSQINLPTELSGAEPHTLDSATKATQEFLDRRAAGDYAGAWLMYNRQVQSGISQTDYVTYSKACTSSLTKLPVTATGERMDGDGRALVRVKPLGFSIEWVAVYEDGHWRIAPSDDFVAELGKPVADIIASETAAGSCANANPDRFTTPTQGRPPANLQTPSTTTPPDERQLPPGYCFNPAFKPADPNQDPGTPMTVPCADAPTPGAGNEPQPYVPSAITTAPMSPNGFVVPGTRYAFPAEYSSTTPAAEQPGSIAFSHRFHSLYDMTWTAWGSAGARGTGTEFVQTDCTPSCADGGKFTNPIQVVASNPQAASPDTGCPTNVPFYTDIVIAYPTSVPPRGPSMWTENEAYDLQWTVSDGMMAAHYQARKPTCLR